MKKLGEDNKFLATLKLFAYDNYSDYKAHSSNYIKLNERQLKKLKILSVITMAGESKTLSYEKVCKELDITDKKDLDEILLELDSTTLDERNQVAYVESTIHNCKLFFIIILFLFLS